MTATTAEPEAGHCWVLTYPNGDRVEFDGEAHFASEALAARSADSYAKPELGAPKPERLAHVCVTISCSCCEVTFDEDGDGVEHHETIESVRSVATQCGWTIVEDGTQKCEDCSTGCDCQADTAGADRG